MLRKVMFSFLFVVLQAALISSSACAAQDNSNGALVSSALLRYAGLKAGWQLDVPVKSNEKITRLFIHDNFLYVLTDQNYLFCIDLTLVRIRFEMPLAQKGLPVSPDFYYDDKVWFMVGNKLVILDPRLSKVIESRKLEMVGLNSVSGMARNDEYLYVCGSDSRLHIIVADEYWQKVSVSADNDSLVNSVIVGDEFAVFTTEAGNVIRIEKDTTKRIWQYDILGQVTAPAVRDGQWLYISSRDSKLYKLDIDSGTMPWKAPFQVQTQLVDSAIVGKNVVYQYGPGRGVYAIDKQNGTGLWRVKKAVSVLTEKDDNAYLLENPGVLTVMNNVTCEHVMSVNFAAVRHNVINSADSSIYVSDDSGRIMKINIIGGK